ncbi:MAG: hypothetical protein L3J69_06045 [Desulfobacula sp.]|nr:hypothetical protein [Desulfobacula sp.]
MNERLMWQGQKQEKALKAKELELSVDDLRSGIRIELNPHKPIGEINHELMSQKAFELADKLIQFNALNKEIKAINKSLGVE